MPTRLPLLKHLLSASSVSFCIHELSHFSYNHVSYDRPHRTDGETEALERRD